MAILAFVLVGPGVVRHRRDRRSHTSRTGETGTESATASLANSEARSGSFRPAAAAQSTCPGRRWVLLGQRGRSHRGAHVSYLAKTGQPSGGSVGIGGVPWIAAPMRQKQSMSTCMWAIGKWNLHEGQRARAPRFRCGWPLGRQLGRRCQLGSW